MKGGSIGNPATFLARASGARFGAGPPPGDDRVHDGQGPRGAFRKPRHELAREGGDGVPLPFSAPVVN